MNAAIAEMIGQSITVAINTSPVNVLSP